LSFELNYRVLRGRLRIKRDIRKLSLMIKSGTLP
jgi:hypothetical protein